MSEIRKIEATLGQPVQINLQSMMYSTGYGWYLTQIAGGVALSTAQILALTAGIGPVSHTFDFIATAEGTFKIEFSLIRPWLPGEVADTEVFEITVAPSVKASVEAARGRDFVSAPTVNLGATSNAPTILKYAAPMAQPAAWPQVIYAAPMSQASSIVGPVPMSQVASMVGPMSLATTMIAYAAPGVPSSVAGGLRASAMMQPNAAQATWPQVIYAAPMSQSANYAGLLYAAPMAMAQAATWPQMLYAAPMVQSSWPVPAYAAPMSASSCGAVQPLYAVPIAQSFSNAAIMQPYAAPFTGGGCCC
jgi:hypothetical protein